jgi:hypothetical protein
MSYFKESLTTSASQKVVLPDHVDDKVGRLGMLLKLISCFEIIVELKACRYRRLKVARRVT